MILMIWRFLLLVMLLAFACDGDGPRPIDTDGDADVDGDGDGDGDGDADVGGGDAPETEIPRALIDPTIDGSLREWPPLRYSLNTNSAELRDGHVQRPEATDSSLVFDLRWTDEALIFAARVLDEAEQIDSELVWMDDSVELYVDGDNNDEVPTYDENDHQYTVVRDLRIADRGEIIDAAARGIVHGVDTIGTNFTIELSVPWTELGGAPTVGRVIGVDVALNDDDDGDGEDSHLVMWLDHDLTELGSPVQDSSLFHDLMLGE